MVYKFAPWAITLALTSMHAFSTPTLGPSTIAPAVYAQLISTSDQLTTSETINKGIPISVQTIDTISGMEWDTVNNRLIVKLAGVYVILSDVQIGARTNSKNVTQGQVFYWIEHNSSPLLDSGNTVFAHPQLRSKTISNTWIVPLEEGDNLQFLFSSTAPLMGLTSIAENQNIKGYPDAFTPGSPSFTATIFKLSDITQASMGPKAIMPPSEPPPSAEPTVYPPAVTQQGKLL